MLMMVVAFVSVSYHYVSDNMHNKMNGNERKTIAICIVYFVIYFLICCWHCALRCAGGKFAQFFMVYAQFNIL